MEPYGMEERGERRRRGRGAALPGGKNAGGFGQVLLVETVICLSTAIVLLFLNLIVPEAVGEVRRFYRDTVARDAGITREVTGVFRNVAEFLTVPPGEEAPSSAPSGEASASAEPFASEGSEENRITVAAEEEGSPHPLPFESAGLLAVKAAPLSVVPLHGRISSGYGERTLRGEVEFHRGVDVVASAGTPVAAYRDGTVVQARFSPTLGNFVEIRHADGLVTRYGHCSRLNVSPGDRVDAGEIVGFVGSTGNATGDHLHFDASKNGVYLDPLTLLPGVRENGYAAV